MQLLSRRLIGSLSLHKSAKECLLSHSALVRVKGSGTPYAVHVKHGGSRQHPTGNGQRFGKVWRARVLGEQSAKQRIVLSREYSSTCTEKPRTSQIAGCSWPVLSRPAPTHLIFLAPSRLNSLPISLQSSRESLRRPIISLTFQTHPHTHNSRWRKDSEQVVLRRTTRHSPRGCLALSRLRAMRDCPQSF